MPCRTTCISPAPPAAADIRNAPPVARFLGLVRSAWCTYWEWRARRATVMILRSLDARTLRDLGIDPSEIESIVQCRDDRRRRYAPVLPPHNAG